jgi:hypothetical protein
MATEQCAQPREFWAASHTWVSTIGFTVRQARVGGAKDIAEPQQK